MRNELAVVENISLFGFDVDLYGTLEEPIFVAADIADELGYAKGAASQMLELVDDDEKLLCTLNRAGQDREVWMLTEEGLYEVLMQSRKPIAKEFKKAVKIALKKIRRGGGKIARFNNRKTELLIEDARLIWTNFAGREEKFNEAGKRNFNVVIDEETAVMLKEDGWNIRERVNTETDEVLYTLKVNINYKSEWPPNVIMKTERNQVVLDENTIGQLDQLYIISSDVLINPYEYETGKKSGFLKTLYVTIEEDYLAQKHSSVEALPFD